MDEDFDKVRERILTEYLATVEGRDQLAKAFLTPTRMRFEYREQRMLLGVIQGGFDVVAAVSAIGGIDADLTLANRISEACSPEELACEPHLAVADLITKIKNQRKLLTECGAKIICPARPTAWEHLLRDEMV